MTRKRVYVDQRKCAPFFQAITSGNISEVDRMLTDSPSLIRSMSLKNNPPLVAAQYSHVPTAMTSLLISKGADVNAFRTNILMHVCRTGWTPELIHALLQIWPEEFELLLKSKDAGSFACKSRELQLMAILLQRIFILSTKEKDTMWKFLVKNSWQYHEDSVQFALDLFNSPAGHDIFEITGTRDDILYLNMNELCPGFERKGILRSALNFLYEVMKAQMVTLLEAMETIGPDIVRPIVFMCLNDSKSSLLRNAPREINAIGERFRRDYMWCQVRELLLARVQDQSTAFQFGPSRLVDLPDACFRVLVESYQELLDTETAIKILCKGFCCSEKMMFKICACSFVFRAVNRAENREDDYYDSGGEGGYWLNY